MPRLDDCRDDIIEALAARRDPRPVPGPLGDRSVPLFERLARVFLGMIAAPKVADAAFEALRNAGLLDPATLAGAHPLELDDSLKQARVALAIRSIRPLQNLARWVVARRADLATEEVAGFSTEFIRDEWRAINGLGLASVDTLLLLGLGRPSYPVDRATYRILVRHGWLDLDADYDEARAMMERFAGPRDDHATVEADNGDGDGSPELLIELGRWFGQVGKDYCKPSQVRCERCPLRPWLPAAGPVEVD